MDDEDSDWPPPPEGALIRHAREMAIPKISRSTAAQRAGISYDNFGIAERGYRGPRSTRRKVNTPDTTWAKMAAAVGVTPAQMADAGQNQKAAELLAELTGKVPVPIPAAPGASQPAVQPPPDPARDAGQPPEHKLAVLYDGVDESQIAPYEARVRELLLDAIAGTGSTEPDAAGIFSDENEIAAWRGGAEVMPDGQPLLSQKQRIRLIALRRLNRAANRRTG
jgi:hypothetical protein